MATFKAVTADQPTGKLRSTERVVPGLEFSLNEHESHGASNGTSGVHPVKDLDYPTPDFERVYSQMRHLGTGLKLADRRWRLTTYTKSFTGQEAMQ